MVISGDGPLQNDFLAGAFYSGIIAGPRNTDKILFTSATGESGADDVREAGGGRSALFIGGFEESNVIDGRWHV